MLITQEYFKEYRKRLGFTNQADTKVFLQAADVPAGIDFAYIDAMNERLKAITCKL